MELVERLIRYCEDIIDGRILASKKHIQAMNRFLDDLEKSQTDEFDYEFDVDVVHDFYEWSLNFRHTKGVLAKQPIELSDFQLFIVANIFGWKQKGTGHRRFRKAYIQLARKNAKSQLLALMASYEAFLSGEQAEVYIAGWQKETSNIVYKEILTQIRACDMLEGRFSDSYHQITHLKSGSFIKALSREARKFGDGTSPSFVILDEFHNHETDEILNVLTSGMVARANATAVIITTAGFNLASPCYAEYQYITKILDPDNPVDNDRVFAMVCELDPEDSIKDETVWIKANPLVATYPEGLAFLRGELQTALDMPDKMRNYLTKNMNKWVELRPSGYMSLEKYAQCLDDYTLDDLRGLPCVVGVDLSARVDLTSATFLFSKDGLLYIHNHSFMPEDTLFDKMKTDKVPYMRWVEEGWITTTPGSVVDYEFVETYIEDTARHYGWNVREIISDPWNALSFMTNMANKGFVTIEARQGYQTLSAPTKDFRERVLQKTVKHDGNPVLAWSIGNAVTKSDANLNIQLDKSKATDRIDPIASLINAHLRTLVIDGGSVNLQEHIMSDEFSF
ncbi:terminase large subunit [Peribacillus frigoritolerans]|uniref:terminase large subunit n=1 Tax=Peribacillus frigoritolerans TaxID=450367 RepID=UPI00207A5E06|nr:terminase TerL endonuclease subunit [Peribacillus frigoritolerans]USK78966.1 terminase large subunit [Peribacillus frigoritolerans]